MIARHVLSPSTGDSELPWDNRDDCQELDLASPHADHPDCRRRPRDADRSQDDPEGDRFPCARTPGGAPRRCRTAPAVGRCHGHRPASGARARARLDHAAAGRRRNLPPYEA
ncbi:hypothetical protein [Streptomyces sp. NPDC020983]|uniref:hypothetical protein n=1 Tax=Streptomyces sp. NPDC020983 TaxID=3365106 RepID=UPI00378FEEC4